MNGQMMEPTALSGRLADHVARLTALTRQIDDPVSTQVLAQLEPRLRQGLVRVAVVGVTGAGKSTMVNALVERLVLPENPSVSSPIPVWLGYQEGPDALARIYRSQDGETVQEVCDSETFRRRYCYNLRDIQDKDRSRYNAVSFSTIGLNAPVLRENLTLIDTLGISATTVDSRKTIRVLEEGVDAVIFVTRNSKLNLEEMRFLYRHVLGIRRQEDPSPLEPNPRPVLPENLLFVNNNFFGVPNRTEFAERVRTFYRDSGLELPAEEIDRLAQENCFYINAYHGRLAKLGPYPYARCAPEGNSQAELAMLEKREALEKKEWDGCEPQEQWESSGIATVQKAVCALGRRLGHGAVGMKRIAELLEIVDGVLQAADHRGALHHSGIQELNALREHLLKMRADDLQDQSKLEAAMNGLAEEYTRSFRQMLSSMLPALKQDCAERAGKRVMPASLRVDYPAFAKMSREGQQDYINGLLPALNAYIFDYCCQKLQERLKDGRADDFKTPLLILKDTRELIRGQAVLFNARIEQLRKTGGETLGVYFPQPLAVDLLFASLEQDLVERTQEIIADACKIGGKDFEKKLEPYVRKCRLGFFENIWAGIQKEAGPKMLWDRIRKHLFVPLAEHIVEHMPEHTGETVYTQTGEAFRQITMEICKAHMTLFVSLEMGIAKLEQEISAADAAASQGAADTETLRRACREIKQEILDIQYRLQHG